MTTVEQITGAVRRLPKRELARFRKWFAEYDAAVWDRQFEQDAAAGGPGAAGPRGPEGPACGPLHRFVKHHANPRFWRCYRGLPQEVRRLADRSYDLLKADP